jgi:hypothetical protein
VALGAIAAGGAQVATWGRGFTPEAWAPAPNPYRADEAGDGQARVPLPTPPQPALAGFVNDGQQCPAFPPQPTTRQGHAIVTLENVTLGIDTEYNLAPGSDAWEPSAFFATTSDFSIASTTGAPTSVRATQTRLYFVQDGLVKEVWNSWEASRPSPVELRIDGEVFTATTGRTLFHLGGDTPVHQDADYYYGTWPCMMRLDTDEFAVTSLLPGQDYQVYMEVRVVADEQSAAQLHLQDEGVDLDTVTGSNGTLVDVTANGATSTYEAIDVTFPAEYLQDQFDEVLVSEPITIRIPDGWGLFE